MPSERGHPGQRRSRRRWRAPRRRPCSRWCRTKGARGRLADVVAAVDERRGRGRATPTRSRSCSSSACTTGRVRAVYGPEGEQAALALFRRLPLGRELTESTRELNEALGALEGRTIEKVSVSAVGPGEYGVTISTEDFEIVLRLGKAGARVAINRNVEESNDVHHRRSLHRREGHLVPERLPRRLHPRDRPHARDRRRRSASTAAPASPSARSRRSSPRTRSRTTGSRS